MRILINLLCFRPGRIGGTETYLRELIAHLPAVARNARVTLLTSQDVAREFADSPFEVAAAPVSTSQISGLRLCEAAAARFRAEAIAAFIKRLRPDVMLYPQQTMFPKGPPCPAVLVVHDLYHTVCPEYLSPLQRWYRKRSYPAAVAEADRIIAISDFTRHSLVEQFRCWPGDVSVVRHGIREFDRNSVAAFEGIAGPYLYYPAITLPHKNHEQLLHSIAALRATGRFPYRLVLTGEQTRHWPSIKRLTQRLSLEDVVLHLGYVPYEAVQRLIQGSSALVFPSRFEGFGIPVLEAAAFSKKIITSRLEVFEEIGVPDEFRIDFSDANALRRALIHSTPMALTKRPSTWTECAAATLEVLRDAAESPNIFPIRSNPAIHEEPVRARRIRAA